MAHFCPSNPCPICNPDAFLYWRGYSPPIPYFPPPQVFKTPSVYRTEKLEELRKEVEKLLESSLFLVGAGRIKELIRELKTP